MRDTEYRDMSISFFFLQSFALSVKKKQKKKKTSKRTVLLQVPKSHNWVLRYYLGENKIQPYEYYPYQSIWY